MVNGARQILGVPDLEHTEARIRSTASLVEPRLTVRAGDDVDYQGNLFRVVSVVQHSLKSTSSVNCKIIWLRVKRFDKVQRASAIPNKPLFQLDNAVSSIPLPAALLSAVVRLFHECNGCGLRQVPVCAPHLNQQPCLEGCTSFSTFVTKYVCSSTQPFFYQETCFRKTWG